VCWVNLFTEILQTSYSILRVKKGSKYISIQETEEYKAS